VTRAATEPRPLPISARLLLAVVLAAALVVPVPDAFTILFYVTHVAVGFLLVVRRPRNAIGWVLIGIALGFLGTGTLAGLDLQSLTAGTASWPDFLRAWLTSWAGSATFVAYTALAVLYPSGSFGGGWSGRVGRAIVGVGLVAVAAVALAPTFTVNPYGGETSYVVPNRFAVAPDLMAAIGLTVDAWTFVTVALLALSVVQLVVRFRRSTGILRVQMRWLVASLCAIFAALIIGLAATIAVAPAGADLAWLPVIVAYPTLPLSVYVAVTRYRLYEIDRIVSRTVGWAAVTVLLLGVFALAVVALQALLAGLTQGETLAVAASTLLAVALFQPARLRVQRVVDRRFDRARYDAEHTAGRFAERLRGQVELAAVEDELVATVSGALRPAGVGVWLRRAR
jgi:hypothetical protein